MVRNRIKVMRAETDMSATALAEKMPSGVDKVAMSYIERGHVLPTREGLEIMCDLFDCTPTDIYGANDLDLLSAKRQPEKPASVSEASVKVKAVTVGDSSPKEIVIQRSNHMERHEGMEQFRVWMQAEEKAALFKAISGLGYHSCAEWLREMYRITIHKYITLKLQDRTLHELIPPTTENQTIGS